MIPHFEPQNEAQKISVDLEGSCFFLDLEDFPFFLEPGDYYFLKKRGGF